MTEEEILRKFIKEYYRDLTEVSLSLFLEKYLRKRKEALKSDLNELRRNK